MSGSGIRFCKEKRMIQKLQSIKARNLELGENPWLSGSYPSFIARAACTTSSLDASHAKTLTQFRGVIHGLAHEFMAALLIFHGQYILLMSLFSEGAEERVWGGRWVPESLSRNQHWPVEKFQQNLPNFQRKDHWILPQKNIHFSLSFLLARDELFQLKLTHTSKNQSEETLENFSSKSESLAEVRRKWHNRMCWASLD